MQQGQHFSHGPCDETVLLDGPLSLLGQLFTVLRHLQNSLGFSQGKLWERVKLGGRQGRGLVAKLCSPSRKQCPTCSPAQPASSAAAGLFHCRPALLPRGSTICANTPLLRELLQILQHVTVCSMELTWGAWNQLKKLSPGCRGLHGLVGALLVSALPAAHSITVPADHGTGSWFCLTLIGLWACLRLLCAQWCDTCQLCYGGPHNRAPQEQGAVQGVRRSVMASRVAQAASSGQPPKLHMARTASQIAARSTHP